jgi:hypothetical protein
MESFKLLNSVDHRKAREQVYTLFKIYQEKKELGIFLSNNDVEIVRADFDQMGSLVKNGTVRMKEFLRAYGCNAYICGECLKDHIFDQRRKRNFEPYMSNFEWLAAMAYKCWKNENEGEDLSKTTIFRS